MPAAQHRNVPGKISSSGDSLSLHLPATSSQEPVPPGSTQKRSLQDVAAEAQEFLLERQVSRQEQQYVSEQNYVPL